MLRRSHCHRRTAAGAAHAGPEKIAPPYNYLKGERYWTVDRPDIKQYREFYTQAEVIEAVRKGKPVPSGAVITMVQWSVETDAQGNPIKGADGRFQKKDVVGLTRSWRSAPAGAPSTRRSGGTANGSTRAFTADVRPNPKANINIKACFDCHKPHEKLDYRHHARQAERHVPRRTAAKPARGPQRSTSPASCSGPARSASRPARPSTGSTPTTRRTRSRSPAARPAYGARAEALRSSFDKEGLFDYICSLHPTMKGQVEVKK